MKQGHALTYNGHPDNQMPMKWQPRAKLKPLGMAIQRALLRTDPGDPRTRLEKLGEKLVRDALAGNMAATQIIFDRFEGRVSVLDDTGADSENVQTVLLSKLVEALVEKKLGTVVDVTPSSVVEVARRKG